MPKYNCPSAAADGVPEPLPMSSVDDVGGEDSPNEDTSQGLQQKGSDEIPASQEAPPCPERSPDCCGGEKGEADGEDDDDDDVGGGGGGGGESTSKSAKGICSSSFRRCLRCWTKYFRMQV